MLTPGQALRLIHDRARPLPAGRIPLASAWGLVLAAPVRAVHPYPRFDNVALDGYAVRSADTVGARPDAPTILALAGTQYAGSAWRGVLGPHHALRVSTGSPLPQGADALVPLEAIRLAPGGVAILGSAAPGWNIRRKGEDGPRGCRLAEPGQRLDARLLSVLAAFGIGRVRAVPAPRLALAVTGDELAAPGTSPRRGSIFDSNGPALEGLRREAGLEGPPVVRIADRPGSLGAGLGRLLDGADVLVVAGGMSVGGRDFGRRVLGTLGVRTLFWGVAQKPGKPLYVGTRGRKWVFGLPGNPAAAEVCFKVYVAACLDRLAGRPARGTLRVRLERPLPATAGKALILKAALRGQGAGRTVAALGGQGSHRLRSLADGDALILLPARRGPWRRGEAVRVLPWDLPWPTG